MKWLKRTPNSIADLWAIMEEAKELYEIKKHVRRTEHKNYERALLDAGIYIGKYVYAISEHPALKGKKLKVLKISTVNVTVEDCKTKERWKLKKFKYKLAEEQNE